MDFSNLTQTQPQTNNNGLDFAALARGIDAAEEATGNGGFRNLPSGGYVAVIGNVGFGNSKAGNPQMTFEYDIAEGDFKGYFSQDFYQGKPWKHTVYNGLAGKGVGITKHTLNTLTKSNPNFDAMAALAQGNAAAFDGKLIGLVIAERRYTYGDRDYSEARVVATKTVDEIRNGDFTVPDVIDETTPHTGGTTAPASTGGFGVNDIADEDIPF